MVYSISDMEEGLFLCVKNSGYERCRNRRKEKTAANVSDDRKRKYTVEVEVVRVKITLACTECKQRNYNMTKEKKNSSGQNGNQEIL